MNKIFKTKYDVTTGQTKVVSELASNRQLASSSEKTPKCGGFLRMFKVLPLALLVSVVFSRVVYGASIWINNDTDNKWNGGRGIYSNYNTSIWYDGANKNIKDQHQELILLADKSNKAGAESDIKNEQAKYAVIIGSRAVGGGIGATSIGYKAIVGENTKGKNIDNANAQGTAVGYRTFARGAGATSLGNDTVAWGDSSIAIGSDGIGSADTKQKKLPKDIFRLFLNNAQNFNYTDEYPAVDFRFLLGISSDKKNEYVNGNGELVGKDGQNITKDGQYYIRKNGNEWNDFYIMREQYGEEVFYKKTSTNSNAFEEVVDPEEIKQIKQKNDYKQKKEYDEKVKSAYEKYLDETGANKKSQEAALKKKGNNVSYDNKRTHTWARGKNSIAVGARSIAYGDYTTAIGTFAIAFKDYSTAIGSDTIAFGKESLVLGNKSYVYADRTVGVGTNVQAINDGAMVYGSDSYAGGRGSLAIGNYALANIEMDKKFNKGGLEEGKEGFTFTDDKNREKYKANGKYQYDFEKFYELGNTKDIQENVQLIKPKTTKQDGTEELKAKQSRGSLGYNQGGIAIGSYSVALGDNTLTIGRYAYAKGDSAIAIGRFSFAKEKNAFAIGSFTRAIGEASIALGNNTYSGKQYSVAIGYKAQSHADKGIALGIEAGVGEKATGAMAIGNSSEADLANSVALGYKSTTNYFYDKNADASDKFTPKLSGEPASELDSYKAAGSTYEIKNDTSYGIISVGGWKTDDNKNTVGLRRIINVAPGALDSDVATVGQLKTLEYVKKEGLVVYYTIDHGKIVKLTKASDDGKFYRVDTKNGEPLKKLGAIDKKDVLVGAKGFDEKTQTLADGRTTADIGETIKFGHLADGEISATSDQAITGKQLNDLKDKLGLSVNDQKTGFNSVSFDAVNMTDPDDTSGSITNFKDAITKVIGAINKGYKFSADEIKDKANETPFYLGATIKINAGEVTKTSGKTTEKYLGKNLQTKFENKDSQATFTIGLKDDPTFKQVTIDDNASNDKHAINFGQLKTFATTVLGAEIDNGKFTFKKSQFNKFKNGTEQNGQILKEEKTFKAAIEANIDKINKGFIFGSGDGNEQGTHYLGDKLIIKAGAIDKPKDKPDTEDGYSPNNIKTHYEKTNKNILIGIKDKPTFKNVIIENGIPDDTSANPKKDAYDNYAVNKKYLDKRLANVAANFTVKGDDGGAGYELNKKNTELNIKGKADSNKHQNITTAVDSKSKGVTLSLNKNLKGMQSIEGEPIGRNKAVNSKIEFNSKNGSKATTNVTIVSNGARYTFDRTGFDVSDRRITRLQSGFNTQHKGKNGDGKPEEISKILDGTYDKSKIEGNAVNVGDVSKVVKAILDKGITLKGNTLTESGQGQPQKTQETVFKLGDTLTIDSSESIHEKSKDLGGKTLDRKEKDINVSLKSDADKSSTITLGLNKSTVVTEEDERVVTSKAVATALKNYTETSKLGDTYLKIDGSNIGDKKSEFGKNVGIAAINLTKDKESTQLVQVKALIAYLKGTGSRSVKISDNPKTVASGVGSIAIGDNAGAKNNGAISIGQDSDASGQDSVSIGKGSIVTGQSSIALGENNKVSEAQSYVIGSDNDIKGRDTIAIGSRIKSNVSNAIILGNDSTGEENTVSVGSKDIKRRIINVADPTQEHDAANKKYVDGMLKKAKEEADKTAVKYDSDAKDTITLGGKDSQHIPVLINNLRSGLGIDEITGQPDSIKQGKTLDLVKKLVAGELDTIKNSDKAIDNLHKAVNLADLKVVAQAGLNFAGNDEQDIHKNLGEKLEIVGKGLTAEQAKSFKGTDGNIAVKADKDKGKLEVSLNEDLKGLKSAEFKDKDGNTANITGNEIALKGKDGQSAVSLKVEEKDGKNTATLAFAKNGNSGTGVITGLADLTDSSDASSAANKKYVDDKVQSINGNRPFDYYVDGKKVVKGQDGNFHKEGKPDEKLSADEVKKVVIKAEPTATPIGISNVASGLGLEAQTGEAKQKATELTKAVEEKVKAVGEKAKALSDKAQTFTDLALAVSSLEQAINALPAGEDKTQAEAKLKESKEKLEAVKKELETAKTDLADAQKGLTEANKAYEANYKGYAKVEELVKPESAVDLTNVATVGDLQAVAKSGLKFKGNDGVELRKQLSETLEIKGEGEFNSDRTATGNIKVEMSQDGKGLEVKLSDQLKNMTSFETREVDGRKSTLNSNGLKVVSQKDGEKGISATYGAEAVALEDKGKNNKAVVTAESLTFTDNASVQAPTTSIPKVVLNKNGLTVTGANGEIKIDGENGIITVPDIQASTNESAVVNKKYVDTLQRQADQKLSNLNNKLDMSNKELRAGIAGALATSGLPMSSVPGKSMFAASAGSYKGQSAVALGYSRVSDNGKITLRLQGTRSSTGDVGGSVGVGYQW
ncbi:hypothetical protein E1290_07530 [Histophilus somni]|uniref:YadA-like family protein n=1 Tax=Histophilus somni TaxID=731 RepID=UPI001056BD04|nr:YadA-like family protein [Histophilus somni]TDF37845.1 hypothetical protein E1290_07530 [Histophilus somni]